MLTRRIVWPAWDILLAPAMIYVAELPEHITQDNIDVIFSLLPPEYCDVEYSYDNGNDLSLVAASNLLKFLPIIEPYDYEILFKGSSAVLTLRHRSRTSLIFTHDGQCRVSAEDRVGNAFLYAGSSKKFPLDDDLSWRSSLEASVQTSIGQGFL